MHQRRDYSVTQMNTFQNVTGITSTQPMSLNCSFRDPEFVFYDQLKQTMNAYRWVWQTDGPLLSLEDHLVIEEQSD